VSAGLPSELSPELLEQARSLALWLERPLASDATGRHRAKRLGGGGEFAEHRDYRRGDELRHIDWKAAARSDRLVVRQFEIDRRADLHLLVDRSASMSFGTTAGRTAPWGGDWPATKWELARLAALTLAFVFLRGADRLGITVVDGDTDRSKSGPLDKGRSGLERAAGRLLESVPNGRADIAAALRDARVTPGRNLLVVISDLLCDEPLAPLLALHRAAGAEVWVFHVVDPAEIAFPYEEPTRFVDLETGDEAGLNPRDFGATYRAEFAAFLAEQEQACSAAGLHYRRLVCDERFDHTLTEFLTR
jgi:uncharacterized protein (DUF58 family)